MRIIHRLVECLITALMVGLAAQGISYVLNDLKPVMIPSVGCIVATVMSFLSCWVMWPGIQRERQR